MEGIPARYLGRIVSKENFRVFIYSIDGSQKLVESWDEFERHMQTGTWFASREDLVKPQDVEILKPSKIKKSKEKKDDDGFLPKE